MEKRSSRTLTVALGIAVAVLAALAFAVPALADQGGSGLQPTVPNGDSPNGHNIYNLYLLISIPAIVIFLLVETLLLTIIIRFRRSKRPVGFVPPQWHGHNGLEIAWTLIPFLILVFIGGLSFMELQNDFSPAASTGAGKNITVEAYRFGWHYTYQEDGVAFDSVGANPTAMVVPVDTLVRIRTQGRDVIHGWWVPYLTGKTDAVPGYPNYTWIKPTKIGEYRGECTELCGSGHATMQLLVKVVSQADYDVWVQKEKQQEAAAKASPSPSAAPAPTPSPSPSASPSGSPSPSPSPTH
jgi:cytochrome c oxidase subunit 2